MRKSDRMLKQIFVKYKQFEKCFFRDDKSKDRIAYLKHKQQFRAIMTFTTPILIFTASMLAIQRNSFMICALATLGVLVAFRIKAYTIVQGVFCLAMLLVPQRYPSTPMFLVTPVAILYTNVQVLIQTQNSNLMMLHLGLHVTGIYFYGMDRITASIRRMSTEELVESVRIQLLYTFIVGFINVLCMKVFTSQFSKLMRKVSTLKDDLSKVNTQLKEQNLKLQSNLEMKDMFIYTFSHELKNALNGLLGNLYLAYDTAKNPQTIQFLSSAKVCGEVLKNFIHNILDSGKLENGNLEVSPEKKDVMHFMQSVWAICGRIIQNKRLQGHLEIEKNVPRFLELDEQRMIQIILNLVSNAVKFTEKGHVRLQISWQTTARCCLGKSRTDENHVKDDDNRAAAIEEEEKEDREANFYEDVQEFLDPLKDSPSKKENHHLVTEYHKKLIGGSQPHRLDLANLHWDNGENLSSTLPKDSKGILKIQVLDSGCGMSSEAQSRLFQKFSQVSSIQGQRKVGTGLGLWICKELVNRLDGDIKTRSSVGVGSVLELIIRTKVAHVPKKSRRCRLAPNQDGINSPLLLAIELRRPNQLKILIADDDSFNIELMKNYLNKFSISYICAHDGEEAVLLFKQHYHDICYVITDNFMPKKTGTEAALEIASFLEEKRQSKIPILCISGDLKVSVGERGITNVIQKPINFDRLKEELMVVYPQLTQVVDIIDN